VLVLQRKAPDTFFGIQYSISDTSTPVSDTDIPILFKILGSNTRYSNTSDYRKSKFGGPIFDLPILLKSYISILFSVSDKY
jgi:hypothetical protein